MSEGFGLTIKLAVTKEGLGGFCFNEISASITNDANTYQNGLNIVKELAERAWTGYCKSHGIELLYPAK